MQKILYIGNLLSRKGYAPTMVELLGPRFDSMGYSITYAGKRKNVLYRLLEMLSALLLRSYDVVLIDTYSTKAFHFARLGARMAQWRNKPYYPILHGGALTQRLEHRTLADQVFGAAAMNVAVSGYLQSAFSRAGYQVIQIPNFLDIETYTFKKRSLIHESPAILWVRSFDAIYNSLLALDILEKIHTAYPDARLCMVGPDKDGSMLDFENEVVKRGLDTHVRVTGKLGKREWHALSADYNIFLSTTHIDNAPVSVTEAMALGLPVVSTRVGGMPWMIEDGVTGLLYDDNDADGAVQAIMRLMTEPGLAENISTSARRQAELLDWEVVKEQWRTLLG